MLLRLCLLLALSEAFVVQSPWSFRLAATEDHSDKEPDLFDYFDPLLSPHAYPNGISPDQKPVDTTPSTSRSPPTSSEPDDPLRLKFLQGRPLPVVEQSSPALFDPTLSPHAYANGTPDAVIGDKTVGVLLMDHGSRNPASNQRLQDLAQLYRRASSTVVVVVEAAHMEIASPSIPEGLQKLIDAGVDEIVCHPYFLSPGKHVTEDIPQIVEEAIRELDIQIPVITTEALGSRTDIMLQAIDSLVKSSSSLLAGSR